MQCQPQSVTAVFLKGYKSLITKLKAKHPDDTPAMQQAKARIQQKIDQSRLRSEYSFGRALTKLQVIVIESDFRSLLADGKRRAREKLRDALGSTYDKYAVNVERKMQPQISSNHELETMFGSDGMLRVRLAALMRHQCITVI